MPETNPATSVWLPNPKHYECANGHENACPGGRELTKCLLPRCNKALKRVGPGARGSYKRGR